MYTPIMHRPVKERVVGLDLNGLRMTMEIRPTIQTRHITTTHSNTTGRSRPPENHASYHVPPTQLPEAPTKTMAPVEATPDFLKQLAAAGSKSGKEDSKASSSCPCHIRCLTCRSHTLLQHLHTSLQTRLKLPRYWLKRE